MPGQRFKRTVAELPHCAVCDTPFRHTYRPKPGKSPQTACSRACGVELRRRKGNLTGRPASLFRAGVQTELVVNTCLRCTAPFLWLSSKRKHCPTCPSDKRVNHRVIVTCIECDEATTNRKYCTEHCARRAARRTRRQLNGRFVVSTTTRRAIYQRDDWTCHLCLHQVRTDVEHAHPWSATLDHLTPRSQHGSDEPDNLACAHRWCNSIRRDADLTTARTTLRGQPPAEHWDTDLFVLSQQLIDLTPTEDHAVAA